MKFEEQLKQFKESLNFPKNFGVSDYNDLMKEIKKIIIEKALNSELDYHLEEESAINSRNGYFCKLRQPAQKVFLCMGLSCPPLLDISLNQGCNLHL